MRLTLILPWENCRKAKLASRLCTQHSPSILQFSWQWAEKSGLVKGRFIGHRTASQPKRRVPPRPSAHQHVPGQPQRLGHRSLPWQAAGDEGRQAFRGLGEARGTWDQESWGFRLSRAAARWKETHAFSWALLPRRHNRALPLAHVPALNASSSPYVLFWGFF